MDAHPLDFPPPWIFGTVEDKQRELNADALDIEVICENHEGLVGDEFVLRWGVTPNDRALPAYRTDKVVLKRNGLPVRFVVPVAAVRTRPGDTDIDYEVTRSGDKFYSQGVVLRVVVTAHLEPIAVAESSDGLSIAIDDVAQGATMQVPHQPDYIPAGAKITFEWEGVDEHLEPVRGSVIGYSNGHDATEGALPLAHLEQVDSIAIRYSVDLESAYAQASRHIDDFSSAWRTFQVIGATRRWPAPTIIELTGDTLVPVAARDGATCLIDTDLVATDVVTLYFSGYRSRPINGAKPLRLTVPPGEIGANLNRPADVRYTVERNGTIHESEVLTIHIGGFAMEDSQLPQPRIDLADGDVVDLSRFTATPHLLVAPWLLMDPRQTVWITLKGEAPDGTARQLDLLAGSRVDPTWISLGVEIDVQREILLTFRDNAPITLTCTVSFSGGSLPDAVTFRRRVYTLRTGQAAAPGRAWEAEDFNAMVSLVQQRDVQMRCMGVRQITGYLFVGPGNAPPFTEGDSPYSIEAGARTQFILDNPASRVRIGLSPAGPGLPTYVAAFDEDGLRIALLHRDTPGWLELGDGNGGPRVSRIELWTSGDGLAFFDNVLIQTGDEWVMEPRPVFETFDDLDIGSHGERLEFATWTIVADRANMEIKPAPGGMVGKSLAVHMNPNGRVHHFTPRFGIRPIQTVAIKMRGSSATPHPATIHAVYFNLDDHVLRTASKRITVQAATQLVAFNAPADLPRENELLSHLRVVHDNGNLPVTVFYDDISLV